MPQTVLRPLPPGEIALATSLAWNGGFVDAVGYLAFYQVFPGTMSGNAISAGIGLVEDSGSLVPVLLFAVAMFLVGITVGSTAVQLGRRFGLHRLLAVAMSLEIACLGALVLFDPLLPSDQTDAAGSPVVYSGIALIALGMGIQNTSLRAAGVMSVYTTHVTGTISRLGEDLVGYIVSRNAYRRQSGPQPSAAPLFNGGAMCLAYVGGACLGAYALSESGWAALLLPAAVAAAIALVDLVRPFARRARPSARSGRGPKGSDEGRISSSRSGGGV